MLAVARIAEAAAGGKRRLRVDRAAVEEDEGKPISPLSASGGPATPGRLIEGDGQARRGRKGGIVIRETEIVRVPDPGQPQPAVAGWIDVPGGQGRAVLKYPTRRGVMPERRAIIIVEGVASGRAAAVGVLAGGDGGVDAPRVAGGRGTGQGVQRAGVAVVAAGRAGGRRVAGLTGFHLPVATDDGTIVVAVVVTSGSGRTAPVVVDAGVYRVVRARRVAVVRITHQNIVPAFLHGEIMNLTCPANPVNSLSCRNSIRPATTQNLRGIEKNNFILKYSSINELSKILNIKQRTFQRILKNLTEEGVITNNDKIIKVPDIQAYEEYMETFTD